MVAEMRGDSDMKMDDADESLVEPPPRGTTRMRARRRSLPRFVGVVCDVCVVDVVVLPAVQRTTCLARWSTVPTPRCWTIAPL